MMKKVVIELPMRQKAPGEQEMWEIALRYNITGCICKIFCCWDNTRTGQTAGWAYNLHVYYYGTGV
jgi:hypothetical protein